MSNSINVGINGFGRIGRMTLRASFANPSGGEVVHINDPMTDVHSMAILVNNDSAHGRWAYIASASEDKEYLLISTRDSSSSPIRKIKVTSCRSPSEIPWKETNVNVVLDCTGVFLTTETAQGHLTDHNSSSSATRVVLSAPAKDPSIPVFVMGVNSSSYSGQSIISNASCTTNCLAPIVKVLNSKYRIEVGLMTTVHSVTISQRTVDSSARSIRMGYSGMTNIIPSTTGAAKAVALVLPEVKGKLTGMAFRVPTVCGSVVDLTVTLEDKKVGLGEIIEELKKASQTEEMKKIIKVDESDSLVSSSILGDDTSSVVDSKACMEIEGEKGEKMVKIVSWYDNEWGYSNRLWDLAMLTGKK